MKNQRRFPTRLLETSLLLLTACCFTLLISCLVGCGEKLAPVSGIVRLDGKPVSAAGVAMHPVGGGPMVNGATDAEGRYRLESVNSPGVRPGEYRVSVVKKETSGFMADKDGLSAGIAPGGIQEKWIVPRKYANPDTSGMTVDVKPGMTSFDIDLKSK